MQGLPTVEGWLDKQGGVRKNWKRRYFLLDGKKLKYFRQQKDAPSKPLNAVLLERTSKVIYVRDKVRPTDTIPGCGFAIETPSRTYILAATSSEERDHWASTIQMALSVIYGLPKPMALKAPSEKLLATAASDSQVTFMAAASEPSLGLAGSAARHSVSPRPSPDVPARSSSTVMDRVPASDGVPVIEDYGGGGGSADTGVKSFALSPRDSSTSEVDRRGAPAPPNLLMIARSGLSALTSTNSLGRKEEVEALKEELVRKDRQLDLSERKLKLLEGAYADLSEKYFVSVAIFAKMNATNDGYYCNIDVYHLYAEAQRLKVDPQEWPQWITGQIQANASRMRP